MPAGGVPGFFGEDKRNRRPVGLDLTFVYDVSGSMNNVIDFIRELSTARNIEFALRGQEIGVQQPNRYSQSSMEFEFRFSSGRWVDGDDVISGIVEWDQPSTDGSDQIGNDIEDVTGSADGLARKNRGYRSGIQRIILSFSDEQSGETLGALGTVESTLTDPATGQIFIAASGLELTISPTPTGAPTGGNWETFGFVYTTPTEGVAIYRDSSNNNVQYVNAPVSSTAWASGSTSFDVNGPLVLEPSGGLVQRANTPRLAYLTGGAVFNIDQMLSTNALAAFSEAIGEVLGSLLYEILS